MSTTHSYPVLLGWPDEREGFFFHDESHIKQLTGGICLLLGWLLYSWILCC
jgi:hypothetical protein